MAQHVDDLHRAVAFYAGLLGAGPSAVFDPPGLAFFDLAGVRLLLDRAAPAALVYLNVDDARVWTEQARATGLIMHTEPHLIFTHSDDSLGPAGAEEWHAFFRDTEGNLVGIVSQNVT